MRMVEKEGGLRKSVGYGSVWVKKRVHKIRLHLCVCTLIMPFHIDLCCHEYVL